MAINIEPIKNLLINKAINKFYLGINFYWLYLSLIFLYIFVGYTSYGYDDEFFNINLIERFDWATLNYTQSHDVHPPGSYFIDLILYKIFGKWEIVRTLISFFTGISLIYAINYVKIRFGVIAGIRCFILLGLNPAILMWCTGLRWYAFFVPILIWLSLPRRKKGWFLWIQCFGGLLLLGYFGYATFIIAPSIFLLYWMFSEECIKKKLKKITLVGFFFSLLYTHQLAIFLNVHIKNRDGQISSFLNNGTGFLISQFSNQGVFPISYPGITSLIGTFGIFLLLLNLKFESNRKNYFLFPYLIGCSLAVLSGLAGKFRNLIILSPFEALWISTSSMGGLRNRAFNIFLVMIFIGNICGIYNVVLHQNTTKNSWNMPVKQVITELSMRRNQCNNDLLVLSYAPDLAWHLKNDNFNIISPFSGEEIGYPIKNNYKCIFVLKTNIGHISRARYNAMFDIFDKARFESSSIQYYGRDDNYLLKRMLDKNYPEYSIELVSYFKVQNLKDLNTWSTPLEYAK